MTELSQVVLPPYNDIYTQYDKKQKRHGHDNDVYDANQVRQIAGCLPVDIKNRRILLISSRKNDDKWVLPKGGWEKDETQRHAAERETWEEAGVKGTVTRLLGVFDEHTKKKKHVKASHWIFEMDIASVEKKFPEKKKRERRWFTFQEALIVSQDTPYLYQAILKSCLNPANLPPSPRNSIDEQQPKSILKTFKSILKSHVAK